MWAYWSAYDPTGRKVPREGPRTKKSGVILGLAQAQRMAQTMERFVQQAEKGALANKQMCDRKGSRLPFTTFSSPKNMDREMRDAFAVGPKWRGGERL